MKLKYLFFCCSLFLTLLHADSKKVDCLILEDENSIICKYEHKRIDEDKEIQVQWINPQGEISRERILLIPAGHGSIYDFRYISGRLKGTWQFIVVDKDIKLNTSFEIQ